MAIETERIVAPAPDQKRTAWLDLALYLLVGFGGFIAFGVLISPYLTANNLLTSTVLYLSNLLFFAGSVLVTGVLRRRLSFTDIGLIPPRLPWFWILIGAALALLTLPLRVGIGLLVNLLSGVDLTALQDAARTQVLAPEGPLLLTFLVTLLLGGVLVPVSEELFFRGALYTWFRQRMSMWPAILLSSALFAFGHLDMSAVVATSFVIGMLNAWLFEKTRSIWVPITVHIVNNSIAIIILYFFLAVQQYLNL